MEESKTKVCSKCGRELPITEFHKNSHNPDGLQKECKECKKAYMREYSERKRASNGQKITPPVCKNPKFADKTPRELQQEMRELKEELIARGFNVEVKCTILQEIII